MDRSRDAGSVYVSPAVNLMATNQGKEEAHEPDPGTTHGFIEILERKLDTADKAADRMIDELNQMADRLRERDRQVMYLQEEVKRYKNLVKQLKQTERRLRHCSDTG